jgi:hypothetical protein
MKFADVFASFLKYLPAVLGGVAAVEQVIGAGNGAAKKQLVLDSITAAGTVGESVPEAHVAGISKLIDLVVATLNSTNLLGFGKKPAATPPAA